MSTELPDLLARLSVPAASAWSELQKHRIPPTPRNYELLFSYFSQSNPELTRQLEPHLERGETLDLRALDAIFDACIAQGSREDAIGPEADALAQAAQMLVEEVSNNETAISGYGKVLAHWAGQLGRPTSADGLVQALSILAEETSRASERNRALERELSASTARIAKLRQNLVDIRLEATTDGLTGIANRKAFDAKLRKAVTQAKADASNGFTLLLIDIDHFKQFNDLHGHRTGDHVLRLVARLLTDNVKGRDTAARYGGEEFAILLARTDLSSGTVVAQQICERLSKQRLIKKGSGEPVGQITVSIGIADYAKGDTSSTLVERADQALYAAKHAGRNTVRTAE